MTKSHSHMCSLSGQGGRGGGGDGEGRGEGGLDFFFTLGPGAVFVRARVSEILSRISIPTEC